MNFRKRKTSRYSRRQHLYGIDLRTHGPTAFNKRRGAENADCKIGYVPVVRENRQLFLTLPLLPLTALSTPRFASLSSCLFLFLLVSSVPFSRARISSLSKTYRRGFFSASVIYQSPPLSRPNLPLTRYTRNPTEDLSKATRRSCKKGKSEDEGRFRFWQLKKKNDNRKAVCIYPIHICRMYTITLSPLFVL